MRNLNKWLVGAVGVAVLAAVPVGVAAVGATSGPVGSPSASPAVSHAAPSPVGTKNLYADGGSASGTMTINSDGTWSVSAYCDGGFWTQTNTVITLVDTACGTSDNATWSAKIGKHGLGTAKKPGQGVQEGTDSSYLTFYTLG